MQDDTIPTGSDSTASLPTEWTPFAGSYRGRHPKTAVRLTSQSRIVFSHEIVSILGTDHVQMLTNGSRQHIAFKGTDQSDNSSLSLTPNGRLQRIVRPLALFTRLGKAPQRLTQPMDLPYRWEGTLLVVDISAVPDADEVQP